MGKFKLARFFAQLNFSKGRRMFGAMSMTIEQVTEEALALPSEARALLADRLAESLDPAEDSHIRKLWVAEARRRRDDVRSGRVKTIPSDEAMAKVLRAVAK
jgi:putative addiction module component (TIGR02574 family)